ncbi:BTB/POZ domain containing protein [Neofusicoccum parvum]|nr:BTB/POZ domain containing protein [Neofusicoccum parvum]
MTVDVLHDNTHYKVSEPDVYDQPPSLLARNLKLAFDSGAYSDLTVRLSNGEDVACHRVILSSRCNFFANAIKPGAFKEGSTGVVSMPNDPPEAIRALLEFLYTDTYTNHTHLPTEAAKLLHHASTFAVAAIYSITGLRVLAARLTRHILHNHWNAVRPSFPTLIHTIYDSVREADHAFLTTYIRAKILHDGTDAMLRTLEALAQGPPAFVAAVNADMRCHWEETNDRAAGRWAERVFGHAAIGMVRREIRCPSRHDEDCGLVFERAVSRYGVGSFACPRCGYRYDVAEWVRASRDLWEGLDD